MIYSQLYPFKFIPDIKTVPKTFITLKSKYRPSSNNSIYRYNSITFFVITHRSIISTDDGLRYDYLIDKIDEIFNLSNEFKSSRLHFDDMDEFIVDPEGQWMGSYICYQTLGF